MSPLIFFCSFLFFRSVFNFEFSLSLSLSLSLFFFKWRFGAVRACPAGFTCITGLRYSAEHFHSSETDSSSVNNLLTPNVNYSGRTAPLTS